MAPGLLILPLLISKTSYNANNVINNQLFRCLLELGSCIGDHMMCVGGGGSVVKALGY